MKNRGFTLVELIIVVAIIAVLAAVLAPQYLQYVERSRESNDLQIATGIVRAATVAAADPKTALPAGYFIEVLWITGDESGSSADTGQLMVRYNDRGSRVSIFNDGVGTDEITPLQSSAQNDVLLERYAKSILSVMGGDMADVKPAGAGTGYVAPLEDALSKLANEANFAFHLSTDTGQVALARLKFTPDVAINRWVEIGVPVLPAP